MQVIHPVCCGIDVHAAQLTACLRRVSDDDQITQSWSIVVPPTVN
jgi:hypothetical protein